MKQNSGIIRYMRKGKMQILLNQKRKCGRQKGWFEKQILNRRKNQRVVTYRGHRDDKTVLKRDNRD